ncbi:MAG: acetyl-CoA decarbonylase/synthase complex subunit gamma [Coriobacteriales bacterium]|jgi:acetyl-CoA decarbonylase/synthase complex subunit gamma|nr:acetyl-CoA decarbonylase/synthase complex subunit gamma [Coriobacteriales bacterium]
MALKGLDIFKLTPKTNCKDCGVPTCMAFAMKVAQGALLADACPHLSAEAIAQLSAATAPPMRSVTIGSGENSHTLGGETVLMRHDKTFVSKCLSAVALRDDQDEETLAGLLATAAELDYERIGERMTTDMLAVVHTKSDAATYAALVGRAQSAGRTLLLDCTDEAAARAALEVCAANKPVLNGATPENFTAFQALATEFEVALGVRANSLQELYDTVVALEGQGAQQLLLDVGTASVKEAFANAVQIRRGALSNGLRSLGYPSIVNVAALAPGNPHLAAALASLFTLKYGSIIVLERLDFALSLPLHGLRQNIFTDPQKPMKVEPGIYPLNGADENAICATTCDFALTYFMVSGELERSGVPVNLLISDAGGYSVLTSWAAGKFTASSIAAFINEQNIAEKVSNRTLVIPGKVAVLKGELEEKLPEWTIKVGPNEAIQLVKYMREVTGGVANG